MKSVVEYFHETYGFAIQHPYWPCLQVGNQQRPNYLPMEVSCCFKCFILSTAVSFILVGRNCIQLLF